MYPSDVTDAAKVFIEKTKMIEKWHSKYDFFDVLNAIFFIVYSGCQWRSLPHDYPSYKIVSYYYYGWKSNGWFQRMLDIAVEQARLWDGQSPIPSLAIVDSQSVKSGLTRNEKGIDGNKKVKGRKRNIAVDKHGYLLAVKMTKGNMHDSKAAFMLLALLHVLHPGIANVMGDSGYRGSLHDIAKRYLGINVEAVVSGFTGKGFVPQKKRWIVERTFALLDRYRRLCRDYEATNSSAQTMTIIAGLMIVLHHVPYFKN